MSADQDSLVLDRTRQWLERAVIGLNLCPFAKSVHAKQQIRYVVSAARTGQQVLADLHALLESVAQADPEAVDTALLILPHALADFMDYNDFLDVADELLERMELDGILQIASFHPQYQFAGSQPDDIENYTNRSPYPILHVLREASLDRAIEAYPDASQVYLRNQETLRKLGHEGWRRLMRDEPAQS
ncbi:DUF1415 domain-containing protein [Orrella sp. JC864]|uniref:DUF1415 domain-containing protein n=1 Tax=Orrella sp. JC864 TaxID=3120298 RepID=UPI003007FC15